MLPELGMSFEYTSNSQAYKWRHMGDKYTYQSIAVVFGSLKWRDLLGFTGIKKEKLLKQGERL